eukprot:8559025-Alexandrium_andersonii.AAC.1
MTRRGPPGQGGPPGAAMGRVRASLGGLVHLPVSGAGDGPVVLPLVGLGESAPRCHLKHAPAPGPLGR